MTNSKFYNARELFLLGYSVDQVSNTLSMSVCDANKIFTELEIKELVGVCFGSKTTSYWKDELDLLVTPAYSVDSLEGVERDILDASYVNVKSLLNTFSYV